jgi:iron complex transport system ATP-binding protein
MNDIKYLQKAKEFMGKFMDLGHVSVVWDDRRILYDMTLNTQTGENVAIPLSGPNGSGKSTFIKVITRSIYASCTGGSTCESFRRDVWNVADLRSMLALVTNELQHKFS